MPEIIQLSPHIANLIAAGEVVERPASVAKELLENAVDAGASQITIEIRDGGMTFLRVTDNGCGMAAKDARTAFLRHATSKLRTADDLAAISTMGFRGEALAAIASVSRIQLLTKTPGSLSGTALTLEAGQITEESEAGCPDGTTIIVRDLFYNTPARMKFMKSDSVESSRILTAVQQQAMAHPSVAFTLIRDGKQVLSTPGNGDLSAVMYCIYGKSCAHMVQVDSRWEGYRLTGFVTKPTDARPNRSMQTFFVNGRPVKSRLLTAALEEAYRNQIMVGKFPGCVLHLTLNANAVDVNVHPAKTEVKFLNEKSAFDAVHYGVLAALNKTPDRPAVQFKTAATDAPAKPVGADDHIGPHKPAPVGADAHTGARNPVGADDHIGPRKTVTPKQDSFFRTMTAQEYKAFSQALESAPQPKPQAAIAAMNLVERAAPALVRQEVAIPEVVKKTEPSSAPKLPPLPREEKPADPVPSMEEPEQTALPMPQEIPWRLVGELYRSYILVEQGDDAYLIDKHAAHERILFEKLKANQEAISSQALLVPQSVRMQPEEAAVALENKDMLLELGFEVDEFGEATLLLRQIPMDLDAADGADALQSLVTDLMTGRREKATTVRDELLHTVACKAAIKAGWRSDEKELLALVEQVMSREDLKHCPHGRPICISLSKKTLEKQFKRS